MPADPRLSLDETALLDVAQDRKLLPLTGLTAPDPVLRRRLVRAGMLRQVDTAVGRAVGINAAAPHGVWDACEATTPRELGQVLAVAMLRAQLEAVDFTFHRWRLDSQRLPDAVYMRPPGLLAAPLSARVLRDRPDAGACLCLAAVPDPDEGDVRRTLRDHIALHLPYVGPLIVGAQDPEAYRTLSQELNADHWIQHRPGHLLDGWPLPLPPLLTVQLQVPKKAKR